MSDRLSGRVALVTGGAQGIGRAIADRLDAAGATVVVGDLRAVDSTRLDAVTLDVTDEGSIAAVVDRIEDRHGRLDIVVNNAGIMFEETLETQTLDQWDQMMAVNLRGPFLVTRAALPLLRERGGSVINIGSIEGFAANPGHTAYSASKGGVHGLTVALAVDLGPDGVRCNAIAPGWIDTELNAHYLDRHPRREEAVAALARLHPVGHIGSPGDVGDVAVWLASDESRFVTGQVITVDGGRTARPSLPEALEQ